MTFAACRMRALVVLGLLACSLAVPGRADAAVDVAPANTLEKTLIEKINGYRGNKACGSSPPSLRSSPPPTKHAVNMAKNGYFSHDWSSGASFGRWIRWYWPGPGYGSWSASENLYWAAPDATASSVLRAWRNRAATTRTSCARAGETSAWVRFASTIPSGTTAGSAA